VLAQPQRQMVEPERRLEPDRARERVGEIAAPGRVIVGEPLEAVGASRYTRLSPTCSTCAARPLRTSAEKVQAMPSSVGSARPCA